MKTATLLISAAFAGLVLVNPASVGNAEAGKVKVRVQTKVVVQKPKPKVRIKVKVAAAKIAKRVKVKRRLRSEETVNPEPKIVEHPKLASTATGGGSGKLAANAKAKGNVIAGLPETTDVIPQFRVDFSASAEAAEAARAAAELRDIAALGALRDAASPDFGLAMPDLAREIPTNAERLGGMGIERRGGMFPDDDLGSGPGGFGTIDNSHSGNTPSNPWGVNIGALAKGVAGDYDTGWQDRSDLVPGMQVRETWTRNADNSTTFTYERRYAPGFIGRGIFSRTIRNEDGTLRHQRYVDIYPSGKRITTITHGDGRRIINLPDVQMDKPGGTASENGDKPADKPEKPGKDVAKLENPDFVDNGSNCRDVGCIVRGEGGLQPLDRSKLTKARVLPAGPDEANGGASATGPAMFTANDVLERYDEDNRRRGSARRLDPTLLCKHSECP
ncbi:MAG: hypothetical protein R3D45_11820 [Rhizobiaceae bacterium]